MSVVFRSSWALVLLFLGTCAAVPEPQIANQARPNIILILADDLGIPDLSIYGGKAAVPTPNIDRLAKRGVRFQRGYSTASVCSPSRAGLLSGQYQQRHGFEYLVPEGADAGGQGLARDQRLMAEPLKAAGYRTAALGKWHLGSTPDRLPTARGFDYFYGFLGGETAYIRAGTPGSTSVKAPYLGERSFTRRADYVRIGRWREGSPAKELVDNEDEFLTEALTSEAVKFIRDGASTKPYFLYLAHHAPHSPFQATDKYLARFSNEPDPLKRVYAAMVSALDDSVGEILRAVEESGQADNTLIIFTSDNGSATYFGVSDCSELSGGKLSYFEGGARIPLLISWPSRWPSGVVDGRNVSHLDVLPTALAAAGLAPSKPIDGVDLSPLMKADARERIIHETLFWRLGPEYAVLAGDWKMLSNTRTGAYTWLYNLADDPLETDDQQFKRADVATDLRARYAAWASNMKTPAWPHKETLQVMQCGRLSFHDN